MCMSVFSCLAVPASAAFNASNNLTVTNSAFSNDKITYTVSLKNGVKLLSGVILKFKFDSNALAYESSKYYQDSVPGVPVEGFVVNNKNEYSFGYMNASGYTIGRDTPFFQITFKAVSATRPKTTVTVVCEEFVTDDGIQNDLNKSDAAVQISAHTFHTLSVPQNVKVQSVNKSLKVEWNATTGAQSYNVYRKSGNGGWSVIKSGVTATSFADTSVVKDTVYTYAVSAVNASGETPISASVTGMYFGEIESINTALLADGVRVSWKALSGAEKYIVSRKLSTGSQWADIATVTGTSYEDKTVSSGQVYNYSVRAEKGIYTAGLAVAAPTIRYIAAPAGISALSVKEGVQISWNSVAGANKYTVYRKAGSGSYVALGTATSTTFLDKTAAANTLYTYSVSASYGTDNSAIATKTTQGMSFGTITSLKAANITNGIRLTWNSLSGAKGYKVYRKTVSDSQYTLIATVTATTYDDTKIPNGVKCNYKVEAYNGNCVAAMSAPVVTAQYLVAPSVVTKNQGSEILVQISQVYGAKNYVIERKEGDGAYQKIATVTATTYTDKNVVPGKTYTYRVKALSDLAGVESQYGSSTVLKLTPPNVYSAYNEVAGVKVRWTSVAGAVSYKIYRKKLNGNTWDAGWTPLVTVSGKTEYIDASVVGNSVYKYTVEAVTSQGSTGYDNTGKECRFIETPDLISRTNAVGGVTIKWNKVAGATSYRIYRRGAGVNYWYYLGDFPATLDTFTDLETANYFPNDAKKNELAKPKSGNYYRYTVRASYDGKDSAGKPYTIYSGFDTNGLYLKYVATPKLASVSNAANGIVVKWKPVVGAATKADKSQTWYRVYRRGAGSTYWYYLGATQKTYFTDTKIANANNRYYRYTVRAVSGTSADKGWFSAFDTTGLYLKRLINPVLVSAASANGGITVKWKPVAGTTGYYVYRKTANSTWSRVGTVGGTNNVTFIDKSAQRGVTYTYTVRACYGRTLSSYNVKGVSAKR